LTNNPALHVSILIDALRGTREAPLDCAASLLVSLVQKFPDRVDVRMYHTPNFRGLKKRLVPQRFNEGWGLQHIKLYGADDEVILSGANLSRDYFTNRQDRYHVFKSKEITAYYALLHEKLRSISYRLEDAPEMPERFRLEWPASNVPQT
jgi:CDP-diacylglycerol--glycerol-3-phosphate 3-phosphatidyltransferase